MWPTEFRRVEDRAKAYVQQYILFDRGTNVGCIFVYIDMSSDTAGFFIAVQSTGVDPLKTAALWRCSSPSILTSVSGVTG